MCHVVCCTHRICWIAFEQLIVVFKRSLWPFRGLYTDAGENFYAGRVAEFVYKVFDAPLKLVIQKGQASCREQPTSETSLRSKSRAARARLSKNSQPGVYAHIEFGVLVITAKSVLYCLHVSSIRRYRGEAVLR